jgi:hypothetical protein
LRGFWEFFCLSASGSHNIRSYQNDLECGGKGEAALRPIPRRRFTNIRQKIGLPHEKRSVGNNDRSGKAAEFQATLGCLLHADHPFAYASLLCLLRSFQVPQRADFHNLFKIDLPLFLAPRCHTPSR